MRLRNLTLAGMILLVLAFTIGMVGATENATGNETPTVTTTGTPTEINLNSRGAYIKTRISKIQN